ncbi:MAG: hypothetical protein RIS64_3316 [Bacteroidota bacterium]|jgi:hypothetical protein
MPRKDKVHDLVKASLVNDGWDITKEPYYVNSLSADYEVDIAAEKWIVASKENIKIAVEVKSFLNASFAHAFHGILGQYLNYAALMFLQEPDRVLYLSVPSDVYAQHFHQPATAFVLQLYRVNLLIFNPLTKKIEQWISN